MSLSLRTAEIANLRVKTSNYAYMRAWVQIGKGVCQGCILSPCSFNLHAEYIMRNAGLEEAQSRLMGEISITSDMQ